MAKTKKTAPTTTEANGTDELTVSEETIFSLELHETIDISTGIVMRVPGGWIYLIDTSSTFVPFTTEFKS